MSEPGSARVTQEEYSEGPVRRPPVTPLQATPGRTGKVNYGLNETAVRVPVLDKVKEARKATIESKPDVLGLRGPTWNDSVALNPGKHHHKFSGEVLSNTLLPSLISNKDARKLTGTTACKADRDAATLERSRSPNNCPTGWNTSTVTPDSLEKQRQLEATTRASLAATRRISPPPTYVDPVSRQTAISETIRAMKANTGSDMQELYDKYGREGGEAMAAILRMPPQETKTRIRATRADLDSVRALDEFVPGQEKVEEEGEAVPLGPS
ncbi:hypothetical protein PLESTB_000602300 [Pleodorina starrii]|uniref:Uncharacterized protein n=1 Tax=Pleodorina starrii TaxID=330485 RepID=A0A9W6F1F3_9CHLO|nr:hypothetical protein PLESTM_002032700 [Pleodorina starrii]GLC52260.1 hypothetical protein PLESTB_000602300 [Pleodorina starrii]GLC67559.1 hypothetical protein PLESTF_000573400 [Pleodorina starrii]